MATQAVLQQRVFDALYSNEYAARPRLQRLDGAVTQGATTATVDDGTEVSERDIIEFEDGEQALVWAVSSNTLTLIRGHNGTTAASHNDDELITLNPIHTIKQVDDALNEALEDMNSYGLYQLATGTDITLVAGQDLYELTETDFVDPPGVLSVFYQETTNNDLVGVPFLIFKDPNSQALAGDLGVRLLSWGDNGAGDTLEVIYAQALPGNLDGGLTETVFEDLAVMYATGKLLTARAGPRIHDPGRYTDRTVQPGQGIRDGAFYLGQYQRMLRKAKADLRRREVTLPGAKHRKARQFRGTARGVQRWP